MSSVAGQNILLTHSCVFWNPTSWRRGWDGAMAAVEWPQKSTASLLPIAPGGYWQLVHFSTWCRWYNVCIEAEWSCHCVFLRMSTDYSGSLLCRCRSKWVVSWTSTQQLWSWQDLNCQKESSLMEKVWWRRCSTRLKEKGQCMWWHVLCCVLWLAVILRMSCMISSEW